MVEQGDILWRASFTVTGRPSLVVQPVFDAAALHGGEVKTGWITLLLVNGLTLLGAEDVPAEGSAAVGTITASQIGPFSIRIGDTHFMDGDFRDGSPHVLEEWYRRVQQLGRLLLVSGTGMYLPVEGDIDIADAVAQGRVAAGWVDLIQHESAATVVV